VNLAKRLQDKFSAIIIV